MARVIGGFSADVFVFNFDATTMTAEKIKIILGGSAVFADNRMISERIADEGLGACEVELDIG